MKDPSNIIYTIIVRHSTHTRNKGKSMRISNIIIMRVTELEVRGREGGEASCEKFAIMRLL